MKYLKEVVEDVQVKIEESVDGKKKEYFIEGIFMQGDIKNRNGRMYPMNTLTEAVDKFRGLVAAKRALGELNHPDHIQINPREASHLITDLWVEGNNIMGRAKILDTPNGKIVKALLDEGVQLGVSSRGFGSIKEVKGQGKTVQPDFTITTVDIVTDPSGPDCFVNPVMENKEFTMVDGMIVEVNEETEKAILAKHGIVLEETEEALEESEFGEDTELMAEATLQEKIDYHAMKMKHHDSMADKSAMAAKRAENPADKAKHQAAYKKHLQKYKFHQKHHSSKTATESAFDETALLKKIEEALSGVKPTLVIKRD